MSRTICECVESVIFYIKKNLNGDERGRRHPDEGSDVEGPQRDAQHGGGDVDEPVGQERGDPEQETKKNGRIRNRWEKQTVCASLPEEENPQMPRCHLNAARSETLPFSLAKHRHRSAIKNKMFFWLGNLRVYYTSYLPQENDVR